MVTRVSGGLYGGAAGLIIFADGIFGGTGVRGIFSWPLLWVEHLEEEEEEEEKEEERKGEKREKAAEGAGTTQPRV